MKQLLGTNIKITLMLLLGLFLGSCTQGQFKGFFKELAQEVPIEKVSYKIAKPKHDTLIRYYAPYQIFKNTAIFKADSICHSQAFNWDGLGNFLWEKYELKKKQRQEKKAKLKQ